MVYDAFKAGAEWMRKQMMKEAVETEVIKDYDIFEKGTILSIKLEDLNCGEFYEGQKVKLIIVKED